MSLTENLDKAIKDIEVKFEGGLSNTSTKKFNDLSAIMSEITSLPEDDIYITSVVARASNTWNRLSQGKPLSRHYTLAVCISSPDGVNGVLAPLGSFIGSGNVHYDSIAVVAQDTDSMWKIKAIATNAKDDVSIKCQNQYEEAVIKLVNVVSSPIKEVVDRSINPEEASVVKGGTEIGDKEKSILAAIRAKPFILLAGMSGTGKTRIVRQLARGCCPTDSDLGKDPDRPGNYECIPVRPNWHDSTGLMGYITRITDDGKPKYVTTEFVRFLAKAWLCEDKGIPFFLCLDEMNLAPVEQYFAEYLSVIESRRVKDGKIVTDPLVRVADEKLLKGLLNEVYPNQAGEVANLVKMFVELGGIPIPSNFVVMGTVNMDETTCSFPRKVLDRAMTFELNEFDVDSGLESNPDIALGSIDKSLAQCSFTHGWQVYAANKDVCDKLKPYLVALDKALKGEHGTPFRFAYRTRDEFMAYCVERIKDGTPLAAAADEATSMKILSRIEGDEQVVKKGWLQNLKTVAVDELKKLMVDGDPNPTATESKLDEMLGRLDYGSTSFWF